MRRRCVSSVRMIDAVEVHTMGIDTILGKRDGPPVRREGRVEATEALLAVARSQGARVAAVRLYDPDVDFSDITTLERLYTALKYDATAVRRNVGDEILVPSRQHPDATPHRINRDDLRVATIRRGESLGHDDAKPVALPAVSRGRHRDNRG